MPVADVPIEVGEDVLDENLAAELLAEEADVAADDRTEIEQDGQLARRQRCQELAEGFGGENRIVGRTDAAPEADVGLVLRGARRSSRPIGR